MSEYTPQSAESHEEPASSPEKNVDHEAGLLDRAQRIINAKKEGLDSAAKEENDAIDAKLKELVESGQITQEGADNRRAQLDRIIGYAAADVPKAPEYRTLSDEDHAYLVGQVADQIDKIRLETGTDEELDAELERLKADLMADNSGITAEEADKLIDEAWEEDERRDVERYGENEDEFEGEGTPESPRRRKAPEGLPTTEELEQNEGKLSWKAKARRLIGLPNVYIGMGAAKFIDYANGRREDYKKKIERREGETDEAYEKRMRKYGRRTTLATVAIGVAYIGARTHAFGLLEHHGGGGSGSPMDHKDGNGSDGAHYTELPSEFDYNHDADPFYSADKLGIHNYGGPLDADPADIKGVAGSHELTENWKHNSGQLSVAAAEMGLPGFSDADTDPAHFGLESADSMADQLQGNTEKHQQTYDQLVAILNKPTTTSHEIQLEPGTYGSYYQSEIDGKLVNAYDPTVNEPGTAIVYNYQLDDGSWHEVIIKKDCGGQVVHMHPVEQPAAAPVLEQPVKPAGFVPEQPQGQGGGNPETQPPATTPPETQPPVTHPPETQPPVTQPPETQPPVTQPPETQPPVTQPPETLAPKTDHTPVIDGAPLAEPGPLEDPAQAQTEPGFTEQAPGQATTPDQTGGTAEDSTVGTGGSRTETGAGDTGPAAADSDLNQSNESANDNAVDSTPGSTGTSNKPATGDAGNPF